MANNPTGWAAVGYGLAGGFERDRKALQEQAAQAATPSYKDTTQGNKYEQDAEELRLQNQQLHKQVTMVQNQVAAKDLEQATDALVDNGNYEGFNKVISSNPTLQSKMLNNYGVKSIRPIDWNNKQDVREVIKAGIPKEALDEMADEDKQDLSRAFYMTDVGHLSSLDDFIQQTGYLNKATSDKFDNYLNLKNKIANIGKKLTTGDVEAKSAEKWLRENPDKTYQDWLALGKKDAPLNVSQVKAQDFLEYKKIPGNEHKTMTDYENDGKKDSIERKGQYQKQIDTFDRNKPNATKEERDAYIKSVMEKSIYGVAQTRKEKGVTDLTDNQVKAIDMVDSGKYDRKELLKLENSVLSDLDSQVKTQVKDDLKSMKANHKMVVSIDRILKEADDGKYKVDKGVVANVKTYMDKIFGNDTPQSLKNIDFNTAGGLLLAGFMKDMSGTAVGEAEAKRLSNIFQGGDLADVEFVKQAMRKFASESREANEILKSNNKHYIPESSVRLTTYGDTTAGKIEQGVVDDSSKYSKEPKKYDKTATNPKTGERMGYINGQWEKIN